MPIIPWLQKRMDEYPQLEWDLAARCSEFRFPCPQPVCNQGDYYKGELMSPCPQCGGRSYIPQVSESAVLDRVFQIYKALTIASPDNHHEDWIVSPSILIQSYHDEDRMNALIKTILGAKNEPNS